MIRRTKLKVTIGFAALILIAVVGLALTTPEECRAGDNLPRHCVD